MFDIPDNALRMVDVSFKTQFAKAARKDMRAAVFTKLHEALREDGAYLVDGEELLRQFNLRAMPSTTMADKARKAAAVVARGISAIVPSLFSGSYHVVADKDRVRQVQSRIQSDAVVAQFLELKQ